MGLSMAEQETVVTWDRASDEMNVYTADACLMARLDKLPNIYRRVKVYQNDGQVVAADYRAEKRFCTLRRRDTRKTAKS